MSRHLPTVERGVARIRDIDPAPYNPRTITAAAERGLRESLRRFGVVQEIVVNRRSVDAGWPEGARPTIVGGHRRVDALRGDGVEEAPVAWVDLDATREKELNVALNSPHIAGDFDDGLGAILGEILAADAEAFAALRLDEFAVDVDATGEAEDPGPDHPPAVPVSAVGEVYELGPHRLVCGDSSTAAPWSGVEGADMIWTDPPYAVEYEGAAGSIENDTRDLGKLRELLDRALGRAVEACRPGAAVYVAGPTSPPQLSVFLAVLLGLGVARHMLVWVKDAFALGRCDYHYRHEAVLYGWKPGAPRFFVDDRTQDTVLEFAKPKRNEEHPTMKPVELVARCIENSSRIGEFVVDPFGGSGTTLIAAAQTGRRAHVVELDPRFCDVIRRRWTAYARSGGVDPGAGALE